jgi:FdhE protein
MMEDWDHPHPKDLDRAVATARQAMPAYDPILAFYGRVFQEQATDIETITVTANRLDAARVDIARKEGFPLVSPAELPVDLSHATALLLRLCRAAAEATAPLKAAAAAIQSAIEDDRLDPGEMLNARRDETPEHFAALADRLDMAPEVLAFFADESLAPSLVAGRRQLMAHWQEDVARDTGYCPVCGSAPALGVLEEDGRRFLICSICRHRWQVHRVRCAACGQTDAQKLYYIYSDEEPAYRIDACEACHHYVKTVDRRRLARPFYPPLEQLLTVHLDLVAAENKLTPAPGGNWEELNGIGETGGHGD